MINQASCSTTTCANGPLNIGTGNDFVIRTPNAPGVDPACASRCPSGGYVFGVGLDFANGGPWITIGVGAPWEIVSGSRSPFCADSTSQVTTTGCLSFATATNPNVYIMTKDPNAPARNITVLHTSTMQVCPPDGGI
jgi:hypothetical protein